MVEQFDEFLCPFCQRSNACGAKSDVPCWCFQEVVPSAMLDLLPSKIRGKACICQSCVQLYKSNPEAFKLSCCP